MSDREHAVWLAGGLQLPAVVHSARSGYGRWTRTGCGLPLYDAEHRTFLGVLIDPRLLSPDMTRRCKKCYPEGGER